PAAASGREFFRNPSPSGALTRRTSCSRGLGGAGGPAATEGDRDGVGIREVCEVHEVRARREGNEARCERAHVQVMDLAGRNRLGEQIALAVLAPVLEQ